jgi:hypothetical protein
VSHEKLLWRTGNCLFYTSHKKVFSWNFVCKHKMFCDTRINLFIYKKIRYFEMAPFEHQMHLYLWAGVDFRNQMVFPCVNLVVIWSSLLCNWSQSSMLFSLFIFHCIYQVRVLFISYNCSAYYVIYNVRDFNHFVASESLVPKYSSSMNWVGMCNRSLHHVCISRWSLGLEHLQQKR